MIALLRGTLAERELDHLIVDVNGVGYRVMVPLSTFYRLPEQGEVTLRIYTSVKEDAIHLFGFGTQGEKELFIRLLSVSGVGPKLALNVLSNMEAEDLRAALFHGDIKRLSSVPGIGKKTAERLVLELREKVGAPATGAKQAPAITTLPFDDALSALVNLGYKEPQAKKALQTIECASDAGVEDMLKLALKLLVR